MWQSFNWEYALDLKHGLGILYHIRYNEDSCSCFFEDGTLSTVSKGISRKSAIDRLRWYANRNGGYLSKRDESIVNGLMERGTFQFLPEKDTGMRVNVSMGKEQYKIRYVKVSYFYDMECSCGKRCCAHIQAAGRKLDSKIISLQRSYVYTEQPVDKTIFPDPDLTSAIHNLDENGAIDEKLVQAERDIVRMANAANSDEYIWQLHEYILDMTPRYEYDARYLEENRAFLLFALFDDPGYQRVVLEDGSFADAEDYEDRQHRSNRVSLKRVLKDYYRTVKEVELQKNFESYPYKEFLLKYRGDLAVLLRYFAEGKEKLELCDMPYLERIAAFPELDLSLIPPVAEKLDAISHQKEAVQAFYHLMTRLPLDQAAQVYSRLKTMAMSLDDIKRLPLEDQKKQISNMPLSEESFCYTLDKLIPEDDYTAKGRFILRTSHRLGVSRNDAFKKTILERVSRLPDSRLLHGYVLKLLGLPCKGVAFRKGVPENELAVYFSCEYSIENRNDNYTVNFQIRDPEGPGILLHVVENEGLLTTEQDTYEGLAYPSSLIRRVCLKGREEEYQKACEKNQDLVDAYLFEQKHSRFAREYQELCGSLKDEKLLFTESDKAGIEWLIYREDGFNALSFKVGHGRMYVVKDAQEFVGAFKSGQTISYGKDLVLTHDTENLNEEDAAVMKILMTAKITKGRQSDINNKRYITISNSLLGNILELLSGRVVYYNETAVKVRMASRKVRLHIDSRYMLSADINEETQEFINLSGKGYLITRDKKGVDMAFLDRVDHTSEEINLIDLVVRNPSVPVKPIMKDFKKNIYSRFFEMFDVDKTVSQDFILSQIRLNTYFDFEKSTITARTTVLKEGKEIQAASLTDRIDQVKCELLQNYLSTLGFVNGVMEDEGRILTFFKLDFTRLRSLTNVYLSESLQNKELKSVGKPVIRVTYKNNLVQVFLEKSEYSEAELEKIIAGLRKKKKYILLSGNKIVDLDSEAARDLGDAVQDFGMDPKDLYRKKTLSMVNAIKAFSHEKSCRVDKYLRDMIEEIRSFKEADITLPKLNGELRDYQAEGFKWLSILTRYGMGGILADDMGLGKTIQVIALIKSDRTSKPSLVVCPKSLVFNWISEFARFDGTTKVTAIYGTDSQRSEKIAAIDYKEKAVYITSYDSLRNDIVKYNGEFNYGVLDEAQYIKNVHALKTKSVKELKVSHRFALTGTPIENSVVDLWSIFDYIMPGYFEELSRFKDSDTAVIARKSAPFILRRVKEDVLEDLPPKYERILSADMSTGQRKLYEALRMEARNQLSESGKAFDILPYLTRLRQVCVDPAMFTEGYSGGSGKLEMLSSLIPEYLEQHHRILIFSQFVKALESVEHLLRKLGIPAYFLSGATSAKDRIEMMDSFNNGSGTDVFLISLKAGGTGLNLTGADTVIHLDPWWNVAAENQASDRTHRIGQTRNVEVIKLIAADSIEQRVLELQEIKKEVIRQVISDDDGSVTSASLEDIAFVLA